MIHLPVLKKEVLQYLNVKPNENFIDCTIGEGGHTSAILEKNGPKGKVLGIEVDSVLFKKVKQRNVKRLVLVNDSYTNLEKIVKEKKFGPIHGILFDLGLSSWHLEESGRGFSFLRDEPLDMRYGVRTFSRSWESEDRLRAAEIINSWPPREIEKIIRIYGEERFSKKIAQEIVKERKTKPIKTTFQLVEVIKKVVPKNYKKGRIHPATRTFQALRIAVNNELKNLQKALPQALNILSPFTEGSRRFSEALSKGGETRGRLVVISYHSLEDRIVKFFLKENAKKNLLRILTKKPIRPSKEEIEKNPRSRSAKLRAAQKL